LPRVKKFAFYLLHAPNLWLDDFRVNGRISDS